MKSSGAGSQNWVQVRRETDLGRSTLNNSPLSRPAVVYVAGLREKYKVGRCQVGWFYLSAMPLGYAEGEKLDKLTRY